MEMVTMDNPYELAYEILVDESDWTHDRFNAAIMAYVGSLLDGFHPIQMEMFGPPEENKNSLPTAAGVYIFFDDYAGLKFMYVGQAKNMLKRLTTHHHVDGYPIICITLPPDEISAVEKLLIQHFNTPINIKLKPTRVMPIETAFNLGIKVGRQLATYSELPY